MSVWGVLVGDSIRFDRLTFVIRYRLFPGILDHLTICSAGNSPALAGATFIDGALPIESMAKAGS